MDAEIKIIIDYVEGRISVNNFQNAFLHNSKLQKILKKKFDLSRIAYKRYKFNLYNFFNQEYRLSHGTWNNIVSRYIIWSELVRWLTFYKYSFIPYNKYQDDYVLLLDILPAWLDNNNNQEIFDNIISQIPTDVSKTEKVAVGKQLIKNFFKYDKTYPRWIQGAEWPIVDGKPMVFSHQSKEVSNSEKVNFYFYNPETKEKYVVTQIY